MLEQISASEAATWAALVFAAGFIGFFGKSLARTLLSVFQKKKQEMPSASKSSGNFPLSHNGLLSDAGQEPGPSENSSKSNDQKIIKKALKAREKAMKKQGKT